MDGYNGNYPFHIAAIGNSLENKSMIPDPAALNLSRLLASVSTEKYVAISVSSP